MTPAYLQDLRPDFAAFEIDCGTIPAFRFQGNLQSELTAGRIDAATAVGLLEDMLMIRELEEMIVTVGRALTSRWRVSIIAVPRTFP